MFYDTLEKINNFKPFKIASAHCDIPCKIYDPICAQVSVLTIIRLIDLLDELKEKENLTHDENAQFNRLILQKEEHGLKVKEEIRVLWGDYFKEPQISKFPELHDLCHSIMLSASKNKQSINKESSLDLLKKVNRVAEIFWITKDIPIYKAICPYPPAQELIYPYLKK